MNPVRLSKDWPEILRRAERRKLRSWKPHDVQRFVDDEVEGTEQTKASVFTALLETLGKAERATGNTRGVFSFPNTVGGGDNDNADRSTGEGGNGKGDRD